MADWMVGVDTGGTFTDLIAVDRDTQRLHLSKVPSTPADPSQAVADALQKLFHDGVTPQQVKMLVHGTTVATNAILESTGSRAGLLITRGYRATYEARGWSQPHGSDLVDAFTKSRRCLCRSA